MSAQDQHQSGIKNRLQTNFFQEGSSNTPYIMGRPLPPSPVKMNFQRPTHYFSNRTHNPDEKMKNWFPNDHVLKESRASSWMSAKNEQKFTPTEVIESENLDDFWESDFSDEFINQIMDDKFEETLLKATQEATNAKSLLSSSIIQQSKPHQSTLPPNENVDKSKPKEKLVKSLKPKTKELGLNVVKSSTQREIPVKKNLFSQQVSSSYTQGSFQNTIMSESQRKLMKPSRSFNLPSTSQSLTTEWLRNQLEKVNKECNSLKESISTKDGENKILREKLNDAKLTIEKQKMDKNLECANIKTSLEEKIKALKKELESAKIQILFKSKEAESNIERYKELKKITVVEPQFSQTLSSQSFKKFLNKSERVKTSFETSGTNLLESSQRFANINTKDVKNTFTQTEEEKIETAHSPKKKVKTQAKLILSGYEDKGMIHSGDLLSFVINPIIFEKAKPEYSIVTPPIVDYNSFDILYNDVSEIPDEYDRSKVHLNLMKIWNVDMTEGIRKKPKIIIKNNWKFSTLFPVHFEILDLCKRARWNARSAQPIIEHVTKMARELYVSFRVPEAILRNRTIEREKEIRKIWKDISGIGKGVDLFSPTSRENEIYTELRRGIALIAVLCDIDSRIQKMVLEQSHFIGEEKAKQQILETFSEEEINNITCVTDSFTVVLDKRSTFCHNRSSEIISDRMKDILNKAENLTDINKLQEKLTEKEIREKLHTMSLSLSSQLKSKRKSIEKAKPEDKNPMDVDCNRTESEQKMHRFIQILDSKMDNSSIVTSDMGLDSEVKKLPENESNSILMQALTNEHRNLTSLLKSSSNAKQMQKGISEKEQEFLNSIFNNVLRIKDYFENDEIPSTSSNSPNKISDEIETGNNEVEITDLENISARKRKMSPEPEASTSKISEAGRKRDLAPLKKLRKDENELDSQDIKNDLDDIYLERTQVLPDSDDEAIPNEQPGTSNPTDSAEVTESQATYDYLYPEELATQCQLLEILLENLRCISCLRFSSRFNPLLESIVALLFSLTKINSNSRHIRVQYLCTMILEILYSRPSPVVLLRIHQLMARCVCIPGFAKMICHNAHPGKFDVKSQKYHAIDKVQFKRGACLLTMVCTLTNSCIKNSNWDIQYNFFNWLGHLFLADNSVIKDFYHKQKTTSGQCSCVKCLDNSIIYILRHAVTTYYGFSLKNKFTPLLKHQLKEIIKHGIRILSVILEIDKYFAQNIPKHHDKFLLFLECVYFLHVSKDIDFVIANCDIKFINNLLKKKAKRAGKKNNCDKSVSLPNTFSRIDLKLKSNFFNHLH